MSITITNHELTVARDRRKGESMRGGGDLEIEADLAGDRLNATDESNCGFAGREVFAPKFSHPGI
jgi:hypothetical protein